jgi:N,N'-diacetylchitobiose transport system permease protein
VRGSVAGVPFELEEAAMTDGCSRVQAFSRVTSSLVAPGSVATGVFLIVQGRMVSGLTAGAVTG